MRNYIYILFAILLSSCSKDRDGIIAILENAPDAGVARFEHHDSYEHSLGSYKDSAQIKYCLVNLPPLMDRGETTAIIEEAIGMWAEHVNKPFVEVEDKSESNIYVEFVLMDGKGGQLGEAAYPPYSKIANWNRPIFIDAYDVNGHVTDFDPVTIVAHEVGHGLGMKHSKNSKSLMFDFYTGKREPNIDDIIGARIAYENKKKFSLDDRTYIAISNIDKKITSNFLESEFYSFCPGFDESFHFIDESLIIAIQAIREYYNQPIQIISTYRDHECNSNAGGAKYSRHKDAQALDFRFVGTGWRIARDAFLRDIKTQDCIFQTLFAIGIKGYGAYITSFHIDTRESGGQKYLDGTYSLWGKFLDNGYSIDLEHTGKEDL